MYIQYLVTNDVASVTSHYFPLAQKVRRPQRCTVSQQRYVRAKLSPGKQAQLLSAKFAFIPCTIFTKALRIVPLKYA
jgi:hypothetical protein